MLTRSLLSITFVMFFLVCSYAQTPREAKRKIVADEFIAGYNEGDDAKMRKHFSGLAKLILSKKTMKAVLADAFKGMGKARVASITHPSETETQIGILFDSDTTEAEYLRLFLNKKNRINGLTFKSPNFKYEKKNAAGTALSKDHKTLLVDSLVRAKHAYGGFNGCVLVVDKGEVIYKDCFGYSDLENKAPLNDSTVFYLASCSKQFTAMGIMMLAEQGKLRITDTLQKFIPDLPYKNITIENLLHHTSGLPDYMTLLEKRWDKSKPANNYDIISQFKKYKPKTEFKPGERFSYSNTGYALLAVIIEKASGMSFNEYMQKSIFDPLGMKHTVVAGSQLTERRVNNWAYGYVYSDSLKKLIPAGSAPQHKYVHYLDPIVGDGNVNSTVTDLVLWDKALRENRLVSGQMMEKAYTEGKLKSGKGTKYGYGVMLSGDGDKTEKIIHHGGGWPGYLTYMLRFSDQDRMVVVLSNTEYRNVTKLADNIAIILCR